MEVSGIPAAVIVTTDFLAEAHSQCTALGMRALEPVVITHPLSTLSEAEIAARAAEAAPQIKKVLVRRVANEGGSQ